jgi:hypothetical protein
MVLLLSAYLINYFLVRSFFGYRWRIFVAPGVIIHELSHALVCLITGAKIAKISFFDKDGGRVEHGKSPIPVIGPILISLAPLAVGIVFIYFLGRFIHLENFSTLSDLFLNIKSIYKTIDFTSWHNILILYLLLSVAVTMTPSWQDFVNIIFPLMILAGILYLFFRFTAINFFRYEFIFTQIVPILNLVVFILLICLAISLIFYLLTKIFFK